MVSLQSSSAKVRLNAKGLGTPLIPENAGVITFTLTKNYPRNIDFTYGINSLYGKWRAVSLEAEGLAESPVDLTSPFATPTYLTFSEKGVLEAEGYLGKGTGRYTTEKKTIFTLIDKKRLDFDVTAMASGNARIKMSPMKLDFGITIPGNVETVTIVLKKQQ